MRALLITLAIASVAAQCDRWAAAGECTRNPEYMRVRCADECAQAANAAPPSPAPSPLLVYTKSACAAWAAAGECAHNRIFMSQSCSAACQCESWASAGECTRNSAFMLEGCADACTRSPPLPPPPPPAVESDCVKWAAMGECETNAAFMMHSCSAACEEATRQRPCSLQACSGLAEHACDADSMHVTAAASPTAPAPWHTLPQLANSPAPIAVINEAEVPARLLWVDGLGVEHAFEGCRCLALKASNCVPIASLIRCGACVRGGDAWCKASAAVFYRPPLEIARDALGARGARFREIAARLVREHPVRPRVVPVQRE